MSTRRLIEGTDEWKDDPANFWCRVCDRGAESCFHPLPNHEVEGRDAQ